AIVGAGNIAESCHLPAVRAQGADATAVAVVDVDLARAKTFAAAWGIDGVFDDLHEMLRAARPDLVVVCTPPIAHRDTVITCLDAGVAVWCEKPPTLALAAHDEIARHE